MKTLLKYLIDLGFEIERNYYYEDTRSGSISYKKIDGDLTIMITVSRNYKGYQVKKAEFVGNSIGKIINFEVKTIKEVIKGLNLK